VIEVKLDGFHGHPFSLFRWEETATGVIIRLMPPLSDALMVGRDNHKAGPEEGERIDYAGREWEKMANSLPTAQSVKS
jgi:hypothetical protein